MTSGSSSTNVCRVASGTNAPGRLPALRRSRDDRASVHSTAATEDIDALVSGLDHVRRFFAR